MTMHAALNWPWSFLLHHSLIVDVINAMSVDYRRNRSHHVIVDVIKFLSHEFPIPSNSCTLCVVVTRFWNRRCLFPHYLFRLSFGRKDSLLHTLLINDREYRLARCADPAVSTLAASCSQKKHVHGNVQTGRGYSRKIQFGNY